MKNKQIFELFLISFLALFWEILFIRWIPTQLHLLSFFRGVVLIAAFLGLGVGCLAASRFSKRHNTWIFCFIIMVLIFTSGIVLGGEHLKERNLENHQNEFTIRFYGDERGGLWVISLIFAFVSVMFVPLGLVLANKFQNLPPLTAYTINIIGGLIGIFAFIILSLLRSPSFVWFAIGLVLSLLFVFRKKRDFILSFLIVVFLVGLLFFTESKYYWSPYYKINVDTLYESVEIDGKIENVLVLGDLNINGGYHQAIVNMGVFDDAESQLRFLEYLDNKYRFSFDTFLGFYNRYNQPFMYYHDYFNKKPRNVLILASGVGNEIAAALRHGISDIDAVEIDPGIVEMGKRFHPELPYNDPSVNIIVADARAYLRNSNKKYDLIIMNALDSHAQIAISSGLRLDSYVFTVESFKDIRNHLSKEGVFITEASGSVWNRPWSKERLQEMVKMTFGNSGEFREWGAGGPLLFIVPSAVSENQLEESKNILVATDDWPQFYMRNRSIPSIYLIIISIMLVFSVILVFTVQPNVIGKINAHFFFLGAGFMLLEIKSITQLSLFFGSTWLVNSIAISAILLAILLANIIVNKINGIRFAISYPLLFFSLLLNYFFLKSPILLSFSIPIRLIFSCLLVGAPIFCAGLIFSTSFKKQEDASMGIVLGSNLLGAMIGGFGEYISLITGVSNLSFIAVFIYLLSIFSKRKT